MNMEGGDWDALASELVRQNYAFVSAFSVVLWDCLITLNQEVKYIWPCPSRTTKYLFLFSRYYAMGYFILCSTLGTQWMHRFPTSRNDCVAWVLIHEGTIGVLYIGSQIILIRKVFNLYGKSTLLAAGLSALHGIQIAGSFILSHHISSQLDFDPICNGRNVPDAVLAILVSLTCNQCITWGLILRKVWKVQPLFFLNWRRYLYTSEGHAKMSWGLCLVAVLLGSSHSLANQHLASVYAFTIPVVVLSMGTCRYILSVEKDRDDCAKLAEGINATGIKGEQCVHKNQSHGDALSEQTQFAHSHPSRPPATTPCASDSKASSSTQIFSTQFGSHDLDTAISNFPYLHGAQSYILKAKRNRSSMNTTTDTASSHSPRISSDYGNQRTTSVRTYLSSTANPAPPFDASCAVQLDVPADQNEAVEHTYSASYIEIGSLQSSSTVNSEELRCFYNEAWGVGSFMADDP